MTTEAIAAPVSRVHAPVVAVTKPLLPPGWPLSAVLVLFPLWWVLGLSQFAFIIFAIPMTWHLVRNRPVRLPPGFAIWLLFLVWVVGGTVLLGWNPPGTVPLSFAHRSIAAGLRLLQYGAATITMVYLGNLPAGVTQRKVVRWLGILCVVAVAGGLLGMVAPHFQIDSPVQRILPPHLRDNQFVLSLVHPTAAQLTQVLGTPSGRPAAPFGYTNTWGNCLTILLIWLVVGARRGPHQARTALVLIIAVAPIIYSLNRGMWLGLIGLVAYVGLRSALHGHGKMLAGVFAGTVVLVMAFLLTPLHSTVEGRLHNGSSTSNSNDIRAYTTTQAIKYAERSPLVGYGANRTLQGSQDSIAIGRSATCPRCGNPVLGENGEIWAVVISNGFVGGALYLGFFLFGIIRFWRDRTSVGVAGVGVLLLAIGFSFIYNAAGMPLYLYLISYGLLWTNNPPRRQAKTVPSATFAGRIGQPVPGTA
jgi:hypothetical protein